MAVVVLTLAGAVLPTAASAPDTPTFVFVTIPDAGLALGRDRREVDDAGL